MHTTLKCGTFPIADVSGLKTKVLNWLRPFGTFCFLDNQQYSLAPPHEAECLVAAGVRRQVEGEQISAAEPLFAQSDWLFGHLSYELKSTLHQLATGKEEKIGFPFFYFFQPSIVLLLHGNLLTVQAEEPEAVFAEIEKQPDTAFSTQFSFTHAQAALSKEAYIEKIRALQQHIRRGDCYEINFCQEFFSENTVLDPFAVFQSLMTVSPNPFSAFYRLRESFLLCASPERFLARKGKRLISQPIKGTSKRDLNNPAHDQALKENLRLSAKEQAENVMVVDLVRNDLTRVCKPATVRVDELFGIYSFPQVHQMISTVSGELAEGLRFSELVEACFPMGSMTGAPKRSVMKLIDAYEPSARGLFSGSVGYKSPDGDFDFNVVIRSLLYNAATHYLSYQVGSGITVYSDAEKEWKECRLKAAALEKALQLAAGR